MSSTLSQKHILTRRIIEIMDSKRKSRVIAPLVMLLIVSSCAGLAFTAANQIVRIKKVDFIYNGVPDIRGMKLEEARSIYDALGLKMVEQEYVFDGVPDISGMTLAQAQKVFGDLGLKLVPDKGN